MPPPLWHFLDEATFDFCHWLVRTGQDATLAVPAEEATLAVPAEVPAAGGGSSEQSTLCVGSLPPPAQAEEATLAVPAEKAAPSAAQEVEAGAVQEAAAGTDAGSSSSSSSSSSSVEPALPEDLGPDECIVKPLTGLHKDRQIRAVFVGKGQSRAGTPLLKFCWTCTGQCNPRTQRRCEDLKSFRPENIELVMPPAQLAD